MTGIEIWLQNINPDCKYILLQNILQTSWPQTSFQFYLPQGRVVASRSQVFIGVNTILHTKLRKRAQASSNKMQGVVKRSSECLGRHKTIQG